MRRVLVAMAAAICFAPAGASAAAPGGLLPVGGASGCFLRAPTQFPGCSPLAGVAPTTPMAFAMAPDGRFVYVASRDETSVRAYRRNPATGGLTPIPGAEGGCVASADVIAGCQEANGLEQPWGIAISPDGENLYVTNPDRADGLIADTLVTINVDPATGKLSRRLTCARDDDATHNCNGPLVFGQVVASLGRPLGVAVSPDGANVYVAGGDGITAFTRGTNGSLGDATSCLGATTEGCTAIDELPNSDAQAVAVSPDGRTVAVATGARDPFFPTGKTLMALRRSQTDGDLQQLADGFCVSIDAADCADDNALFQPAAVAFSPDGAFVYVASYGGDAIVPVRVTAPGEVAPVPGGCAGQSAPGCADAAPLDGPLSVVVSADGEHVYAAARDSQVVRTLRRKADGGLAPVAGGGCWGLPGGGCAGAPAAGGVEAVGISPDGHTVYSAATTGWLGNEGVGVFRRDLAAPTCADAGGGTAAGQPVTLPLPCADADDATRIEIVAGSPNGGLGTIDQGAKAVRFAPLPGFSGRTTFTFRAVAGTLTTRTATYTVDVAAPPAVTPRVESTVRNKWAYSQRLTKIIALKVRGVPAGGRVDVRCKGGKKKRCSFKRKVVAKPDGGSVNVRKLFKRKALKPGAKIVIRVTLDGAIGRYVAYKIRAGKIPKLTSRCLAPGSTEPVSCTTL